MSYIVSSDGAYTRPLGDSEYPLYPASAQGLGDMFLHLGFSAHATLFDEDRVAVAWAIIRVKHPVLAARVQPAERGAYFVYKPPVDVSAAIDAAKHTISYSHASKNELISNYMDGPRGLSDDHLSHLVISRSLSHDARSGSRAPFDLLMAAPHYTGDGTTLHQTTHDLLAILAQDKTIQELEQDLAKEMAVDTHRRFASAAEDQIPAGSQSSWFRAASKINYLQVQANEVGGHSLPREQRGARLTLLLERALDKTDTAKALARCKKRGVSINHALFALANLAWIRLLPREADRTLPTMTYTALSLRPYLKPPPGGPDASYWFLALGYFNIVLPSFLPASRDVLWVRAKSVGRQTQKVLRSPFLISRVKIASAQRGARARGSDVANIVPPLDALKELSPRESAPSAALMGLSLVGNLDKVYDPVKGGYADSIELHSVTTASRLKPGGVLLLAHSFAGQLWVHLCYDSNGFAEGKMEAFWNELGKVVEEYLVDGDD